MKSKDHLEIPITSLIRVALVGASAQGDLFPAETINSRLSLERYKVIFEWLRVVGF